MANKNEALVRSPLFSSIAPSSRLKISAICGWKSYAKDSIVFEEQEAAFGFFIVAKGTVKVFKLSAAGGEHILHVVGAGGSIAEAVAFGNLSRYPAYAQALTDSELIFIPKKDFLSLMRSDFSLVLSVLGSLSERLRYFNTLVEELSLKDADARLAKHLLDLALRQKSDSFLLDAKKIELARRLGIAPETLSRIFKKFAGKHIIRLNKTRVQLLDKPHLVRLASGEKV